MHKSVFHAIGLMSGTSLDGLDMAWCTFYRNEGGHWIYDVKEAECAGYDEKWHEALNKAPDLSGHDLLILHRDYAAWMADKVNAFILKHQLKPDFIASHGHTIYHEPEKGVSFQLGDGAALHAMTGFPVVCDFRSVDVNLGGQGAPLVPIGDKLLFGEYDHCLNLGGIANISFNDAAGNRIAYDICGCNLLLNELAAEKGLTYDKDGAMAAMGTVDSDLLQKLNAWSYLNQSPPKSLDKETMLGQLRPVIASSAIRTEDKLATVAEHIAMQIAEAVKVKKSTMLATGGGALNKHLVSRIQTLAEDVKITVPQEKIVQYKEALVFAFLGVLRVLGEVNTLKTVTGAEKDSIGGALYGVVA